MIGYLFAIFTIAASGILLVLIDALDGIPNLNDSVRKILTYLLLTVFTTYWGKLNNENFEFLTFFRFFKMPFRLRWKLRISFAYLIRIKIDNSYILIRNGNVNDPNFKNKFQPVGGVFKMLNPTETCRKFGMIDDVMPSPFDDIRKRLKNPFKIFSVLSWFRKKDCIEAAPHREFYEELLKPNILPVNLFANTLFEKVTTKYKKVIWSEWNEIYEYKIFEIYEARLTYNQQQFLRQLIQNHPDDIRFLKRDDIEKYEGIATPWGYALGDNVCAILE